MQAGEQSIVKVARTNKLGGRWDEREGNIWSGF